MFITLPTVRVVCFHSDFYCIGYDIDKVRKGINDETKLKDIDKSKKWNDWIQASKKTNYSEFEMTKEELIEEFNKFSTEKIVQPI